MKIVKPKKLKHGDLIGVCAPASPPASAEALNRGVEYIERCGFRVEVGEHLNRRHGYLAGSDRERAEDLNKFFSDRRIRAIFSARGGYGTGRLLPLLDYGAVRRDPKIVVGYSDITALHLALLEKAGLISFSGPLAAVEMSEGLAGKLEERFWDGLMKTTPPGPLRGTRSDANKAKRSSGRLLGGNLTLMAAMCGTEYFPSAGGFIYMFEEIDEKPYRIDRMLQQMELSGKFSSCAGVALGKFIGCEPAKGRPSLDLRQVFKEKFGDSPFPVVSNIRYGHFKGSMPFPFGVKVRLDGGAKKLEFLEAGVC